MLRRAIRQLEDDVRTHRAPDDAEIHADGVLAPGRPRGRRRPPAGRARPPPAAAATELRVTGVALGWAACRRPAPLPSRDRPAPPGSRTVTTDDGVPLHVEVDGDPDAPR